MQAVSNAYGVPAVPGKEQPNAQGAPLLYGLGQTSGSILYNSPAPFYPSTAYGAPPSYGQQPSYGVQAQVFAVPAQHYEVAGYPTQPIAGTTVNVQTAPQATTLQPSPIIINQPIQMNPPSFLGWSIFNFLCCFWPLGLAALIYSTKVGTARSYDKAKKYSIISRNLNIAATVLAPMLVVIIVGSYLGSVSSAVAGTRYYNYYYSPSYYCSKGYTYSYTQYYSYTTYYTDFYTWPIYYGSRTAYDSSIAYGSYSTCW